MFVVTTTDTLHEIPGHLQAMLVARTLDIFYQATGKIPAMSESTKPNTIGER